ncbi:Organic solvent tolerance protein OstA [Candidatus Terasakiella magnetica]|nr:Organic solvent tolerance protein OstA [Candidatus Terasakiella magnetica]
MTLTTPRRFLLFTLLAASTAITHPAQAEFDAEHIYPEVGDWGQAWGSDDAPAAAPARPRVSAPPPGYVAPPPAVLRTTPPPSSPRRVAEAPIFSESELPPVADGPAAAYPEVGGWGQAWGEDEGPAAPQPRSRAVAPAPPSAAAPLSPAAAEPQPAPQAAPARTARKSPRTASSSLREATYGQEQSGDAVGLIRSPRIVPRALGGALKQDEGADVPIRMTADQLLYDREYEIVTATGRVEVQQAGRTITADTISYNLKQDAIGAAGNVVLTEDTGEVTFAEYFELTGDFKNGVARQIRMILADNSRLAAQSAQRVGGDRTDFDRAVYTACEPCRDDPTRTPLWQAKAQRVTHNQAEAQIEYRDAWIELAGVPIIYTPYLSHPDPSVKRKSGFLAPVVGSNSSLGPSVATPYFFVLNDSEDITLSPRFMLLQSKKTADAVTIDDVATNVMRHMQMSGQHRWRGMHGETRTEASIVADRSTGELRGHAESKGVVDLDRRWRAGWQLQYQSDETYRSLYRVKMTTDRPWLVTRPYVEGFGRRNYAMAETMNFQGHRVVEDTSKSPIVLPHMVHQSISDPGWLGSHWTYDTDVLSYIRTQGVEAQRLSSRAAWTLPLTSPDGQIYTMTASMRGDGYHARRLVNVTNGEASTGRVIPEVAVTWRYPFSRPGSTVTQVFEPMAMVAASPIGGNGPKIPNEDSIDFELDETNVMRPNRMVGLDRVEGGVRGGYGARWSAYPYRGGAVVVQAAQGWRQHADRTFSPGNGFADSFSDYLGRVDVIPTGMLTLTDRIRLDKTSLEVRRNEAGFSLGPPALTLQSSYAFLSPATGDVGAIYSRRQYISYGATSMLTQYWRANFNVSQDLVKTGGTLGWTAATTYNDECFAITSSVRRYFTSRSDLNSGYDLMLTFVLKTLGEAPLSLGSF